MFFFGVLILNSNVIIPYLSNSSSKISLFHLVFFFDGGGG